MATDRFRCTRCDETFGANKELQEHRVEVHGEEIAEALRHAEAEVKRIQRM